MSDDAVLKRIAEMTRVEPAQAESYVKSIGKQIGVADTNVVASAIECLLAAMVVDFAPDLLEHAFHPEYSDVQVSSHRDDRPLRQVWLPNASHVDMLHHLAYAYTFARKGEAARLPALNALGRAAGWLFREFNRPGQISVMAASDALKESYTFPCEDVRQGHLG